MAEQNKNAQETGPEQAVKGSPRKISRTCRKTGKDPFQIAKYDVTHHSQEIKDSI